MALLDVYSRRKRLAEKSGADVYQYVDISPKLRRQILFVFEDVIKTLSASKWQLDPFWEEIVRLMRRELGVSTLSNGYYPNIFDELFDWFMNSRNEEQILDAVEFMAVISDHLYRNREYGNKFARLKQHIDVLNGRFLEAGSGFQIEDNHVVQISSKFIHSEVVVPALSLLANPKLANADTEFRKAHSEFRAGSYEDCVTDCCKAFESVLKVISAEKHWGTSENASAKVLIQAAYDHKLIPDYMQNEFTGLRSILEGGVPTIRNKSGGHGQGAVARTVSSNLASFQLHQTAAAILFLITEAGL